ncbi:MAG: terpene cyclase/mutase family protein [Chloroflexota bacterium]|nr:terpene cyclase/mutase family protein [Chloroflexota bacterium]MDQ5865245.1 terpene cyclase/mutase family protein [Chloroflexota bacterium]
MLTMRISQRKTVATLLASLLVLLSAVTASAQTTPPMDDAAHHALGWMRNQTQPDGSFPGFGAGSTVDAVLAIAAAGQDPGTYNRGGKTPLDFLEANVVDLTKSPGSAGKLLLAVSAVGRDPRSFGGVNLVDTVNASYDATTGHYGQDVIGHAFVILGLRASGAQVPANALAFLDSTQTAEGGWSFSGDKSPGAADTNTTAVVIQAYVAAGAQDRAHQNVLRTAWTYLMSQQNPDGGFPYQKGGAGGSDSDVNSTAYAAQALIALGGTEDARRPLEFIVSLQKPSGAFQWMKSEPDENPGATYQAIPALLAATLAAPTRGTSPVPGVDVPGMPTTGNPVDGLMGALAGIAALALGMGVLARRKAPAR